MKKFKDVEKEYLLNALKECNFNVRKASIKSGFARSTFYKKLNTHFGVDFLRNFKIVGFNENQIIAVPVCNNENVDADLMNKAFNLANSKEEKTSGHRAEPL